MPPIHDTDLAEERWAKAEWEHFELWEKIDQRLRKRKRLWIAAAVVLFVLLSSVVVVRARRPYWKSVQATHRLGIELNRIRRDAAIIPGAFRLKFRGQGSLVFDVWFGETCKSTNIPMRSGRLLSENDAPSFRLLNSVTAKSIGMTGIVESFCFDTFAGSDLPQRERPEYGFAVIPLSDLDAVQSDRMSVLLVSGTSAEISNE